MFMENLPKKGPLFREFWAQKPTHMGGTYPYPQRVMLPLPPPGMPTLQEANKLMSVEQKTAEVETELVTLSFLLFCSLTD